MKKNFFSICAYVSAVFFLGFVGLYVYALAANSMPHTDESGIHWLNITVKHNPPITVTNYPSKTTSIDDPSVHMSITKDRGGNIIFFNQKDPCIGALII